MREEVLCGLGWEILRVWSTDWWRDREEALNRLDAALNVLLEESRTREAAPVAPMHWALGETFDPPDETADLASEPLGETPVLPSDHLFAEEDGSHGGDGQTEDDFADLPSRTLYAEADGRGSPEAPSDQPVYQLANLSGFAADPDLFHEESYAPRLAAMVEAVLAAEAPLREDLLAQRIARAHGWLRTGTRIKAQVARHLAGAERTSETSGEFIWLPGTVCESLAFRHSSGAQRRGIDEIPLAELVFLASTYPDLQQERDAPLALARHIGIDRLGSAARMRLHLAIARASQQ